MRTRRLLRKCRAVSYAWTAEHLEFRDHCTRREMRSRVKRQPSGAAPTVFNRNQRVSRAWVMRGLLVPRVHALALLAIFVGAAAADLSGCLPRPLALTRLAF